MAPPVVISLEVIAQKHESNPFGFELGLLAKASYQGHATGGETIWEHTKGSKDFYKSGRNNMSLIHFGFELGLLSKASYQGQSTGRQKEHMDCMDFHKSGQNN